MHKLIADFSIPFYVWLGVGAAITLFLVKPKFRSEIDSLFARMLGMKPRRTPKQDEDEEEN